MHEPLRDKLLCGTSGWSYADWVGPFYPEGTPASEYLSLYAREFPAVEVDSTFYRLPARKTVEGWAARTPETFRFALKVPRTVTHGAASERPDLNRVLLDPDGDLERFLEVLEPLGPRLGVVVFQFPYFRVREMDPRDFLDRLASLLDRLPAAPRFAVEIRNKTWITREYLELLARHRVGAVLIDHPYMPPPRRQLEMGMVTADFAYIRLLGDRYGIEKITRKWGEEVADRSERISEWAEVILEIASRDGVGAAWAFANNHFAGHAPASVRRLLEAVRAADRGPS